MTSCNNWACSVQQWNMCSFLFIAQRLWSYCMLTVNGSWLSLSFAILQIVIFQRPRSGHSPSPLRRWVKHFHRSHIKYVAKRVHAVAYRHSWVISGIARTWKRLSQYVISMNYNYDADDRIVGTICCSGFRYIYTYEQLVTPQGRKNWVECPSYD